MKSNSILTAILVVCLVVSAWCCWLQIAHTRELRNLGPQVAGMQQFRGGVQSLLADCVEYSKKNPEINRILQPVLNPQPAPQSAAPPAASATPATTKPVAK